MVIHRFHAGSREEEDISFLLARGEEITREEDIKYHICEFYAVSLTEDG